MMLQETKNVTDKREWILAIVVILAPMTGFRIWKIGPAEVLVLVWIIMNLNSRIISANKLFMEFWISFLITIFLGSIWGTVFYPDESSMSGILTWCYFAIVSISVLIIFDQMSIDKLIKLLKEIAIGTSVWYLFLYVYSKSVSSTFMGAPLWYGGARFSGGATNPHQVAMLLGVTSVISLYFFLKDINLKFKILYIFSCLTSFFLLSETESSTGLMATICAAVILVYLELIEKFKNKRKINIAVLVMLVLIVVIAHRKLWELFINWVASDMNGIGRFEIFSTIGVAFWKNPVFGLGPGMHANDGTIEFHNSYLEIIAMGGLVGIIIFLYFSLKIFLSIRRSNLCVACFLVFYIFGFAGFSVRRLIFWIIVPMLYVYSKKINNNFEAEKNSINKP